MRLIDADELLTAFPIGDEPMVTIACIRATIEHMPTIEERKTGDLISRQAAIDALTSTAGVGNRALDKIRSLPSAQPDRR